MTAFCEITGYRRKEVLGTNPRFLGSGMHDEAFYRAMWRRLIEEGYWSGEVWNRRKDGELFAELLTISAVRDEDGRTTQHVGLFNDITLLKRHESELETQRAFRRADETCRIASCFPTACSRAWRRRFRRGQSLAVAFIDIDGFKSVNDQYGHDAGDHSAGHRIESGCAAYCAKGDTLARLGGDEFVAVLLRLAG